MTRDQIIATARTYVGLPWIHQGRSMSGIDCVGLLTGVMDAYSVPYVDKVGYARTPEGRDFMRHLYSVFPPRRGLPVPGSIGVFKQGAFPCHVGIFASMQDGGLSLINADIRKRGVVEVRYSDKQWHLVQVCDFPGVED